MVSTNWRLPLRQPAFICRCCATSTWDSGEQVWLGHRKPFPLLSASSRALGFALVACKGTADISNTSSGAKNDERQQRNLHIDLKLLSMRLNQRATTFPFELGVELARQ